MNFLTQIQCIVLLKQEGVMLSFSLQFGLIKINIFIFLNTEFISLNVELGPRVWYVLEGHLCACLKNLLSV